MVRMAQPWSLRYMLVDGQGNFGSVDGDSPAAMRYTEARLQRIAEEMLADINKDTIDYQPNFDDSLEEPVCLPGKLPNVLVNGTSGIAVGMATNMPPHNLTEVVDGITAYIDNPEITISELMQHITAPDFPTGAIIYGYQGVKAAFETGRGRIVLRAKAEVVESKTGKIQIIVTEIPYQVNKAAMIEKTAALNQRETHRGHHRAARRIGPQRHAHRLRPAPRRHPQRGAQYAVQVHPVAIVVRSQQRGAGAGAARNAKPQADYRPLRRPPARRGGAAHPV